MKWQAEAPLPDIAFAKTLWPLARLICGLALGLLLANLLEALRWTDRLAKLARPLARLAHLGPAAASAFALAFVSPAAANGLLSEKLAQSELGERELMLANLFNSLPAWLAHTPTIFLLTWPVLGVAAIFYVGATLLAALGRTIFTIFLSRLLLPPELPQHHAVESETRLPFGQRLVAAFAKAWRRFLKRMPRLAIATSLVYLLMWLLREYGAFQAMEAWLASHLGWLAIIKPQAMGIIVLQLFAEMGATLGAAGAALQDASLSAKDVVVAMLVGNVLSTPLRAIRHQLPAYAGFFRPALAVKLVLANQSLRAASMIAAIAIYALFEWH